MLKAAKRGFLVGIPFATFKNINAFYPETKATPKGHIEQQRQGVRSTKQKETDEIEEKATYKTKEQDVFVKVWDLKETTYSDQTGRFPFTSYSGNKYLMIMVEIDSSIIIAEPLTNKTTEEMKKGIP